MFTIRLVQGDRQTDAEMEAVPRIGESILQAVGPQLMLATVENVTWELSAFGPGTRVVYLRLGPNRPWNDAGSA